MKGWYVYCAGYAALVTNEEKARVIKAIDSREPMITVGDEESGYTIIRIPSINCIVQTSPEIREFARKQGKVIDAESPFDE